MLRLEARVIDPRKKIGRRLACIATHIHSFNFSPQPYAENSAPKRRYNVHLRRASKYPRYNPQQSSPNIPEEMNDAHPEGIFYYPFHGRS